MNVIDIKTRLPVEVPVMVPPPTESERLGDVLLRLEALRVRQRKLIEVLSCRK